MQEVGQACALFAGGYLGICMPPLTELSIQWAPIRLLGAEFRALDPLSLSTPWNAMPVDSRAWVGQVLAAQLLPPPPLCLPGCCPGLGP